MTLEMNKDTPIEKVKDFLDNIPNQKKNSKKEILKFFGVLKTNTDPLKVQREAREDRKIDFDR